VLSLDSDWRDATSRVSFAMPRTPRPWIEGSPARFFAVFVAIAFIPLSMNADTTPTANLPSTVYDWETMPVIPTPKGVRRDVFDGPTTTVDKAHCHITTLSVGENSGEPRRHLQEEIIIVKEGTVEATFDGKTQTAGPGSIFFFAANAVTRLRNAGTTPCTYIVVYYFTPLTPKS
jgi:mannose-6-phosphate isomerase-like protein (cupin superfamily)